MQTLNRKHIWETTPSIYRYTKNTKTGFLFCFTGCWAPVVGKYITGFYGWIWNANCDELQTMATTICIDAMDFILMSLAPRKVRTCSPLHYKINIWYSHVFSESYSNQSGHIIRSFYLSLSIPDEYWLFCFGYINQREHPTISKDRTHMILNSCKIRWRFDMTETSMHMSMPGLTSP